MEEPHSSGQSPPSRPESAAAAGENAPATDSLHREIDRLKERLKEVEHRQLPERERHQRELAQVTAERDAAAGELRQLKRRNAVMELARQNRFNDPDYLDYLLERRNIAPTDTAKTADFLREFRHEQPRFFDVELKSGAGSRPDAGPAAPLLPDGGAPGIAAMLADAPEVR